ncbi:hypothetical protein IQ260_15810 [Leptolyngbya cf. ectocarpi LEGE 11479]|uniref:Uncharacterized protein n=1 Tax=Leptolyngbya cf. ectocarpi LEGE 11479 TaxID=1828722 RepID=A0A928ZVD1_LEPEC|nr:hypothetical protein [Leptolyngbya ectocarpi]MBE9068118.1 hypothetical protein [Leptolyngbya cf. ectocarpi LEGE 11479]
MAYSQLHASQLKIQWHEILDAVGFGRSWLASVRFSLQCFAAPELSGLSHLLDQVDQHNHLVSAIAIDIQKATDSDPDNDLAQVIKIFSQTKKKIIQAIAQYGAQPNENTSGVADYKVEAMSCDMGDSSSVYSWLMRKSCYLRMQAQVLVYSSL